VDIQYHSNIKIMTEPVNLYNIYIGDFTSLESQQTVYLMDYLAANIGNSSWYTTLSPYYQINADTVHSKSYVSNNVQLSGSLSVRYSDNNMVLTDYDVMATIANLIDNHQLPLDENGVYSVMFSAEYTYDGWLGYWCALHSAFYSRDGVAIKFMVIGDPSKSPDGATCEAISDGKQPKS
jgi:hypothetical protein